MVNLCKEKGSPFPKQTQLLPLDKQSVDWISAPTCPLVQAFVLDPPGGFTLNLETSRPLGKWDQSVVKI